MFIINSKLHVYDPQEIEEALTFMAISLALALSTLATLAANLPPREPPPQWRLISSPLSLKLVQTDPTSLFIDERSLLST